MTPGLMQVTMLAMLHRLVARLKWDTAVLACVDIHNVETKQGVPATAYTDRQCKQANLSGSCST